MSTEESGIEALCLICEEKYHPNDTDDTARMYVQEYGVCPTCREDAKVGAVTRKHAGTILDALESAGWKCAKKAARDLVAALRAAKDKKNG